jgi:nicotinamidase-related amidase
MPVLDRLTARDGALLVVDVQGKLLRAVRGRDRLVANAVRLVRAAGLLEVPVFATEQYPKGLGPTVPELADLIPDRPAKTTFHCCAAPGIVEGLAARGVRHVTLVGIEAHVCIAQTALELLRLGYEVQVPADAVGSRFAVDEEFALRRLERAGAVVSSTESALFEWTEGAEHPKFKEISALVKEREAE